MQNLIDVRTQLDRYVAPDTVEWHFASIGSRWTKRALTAAGFGFPSEQHLDLKKGWAPVFSVASSKEANPESASEEVYDEESGRPLKAESDRGSEEIDRIAATNTGGVVGKKGAIPVVVSGTNRPFFHIDIDGALKSAISSIENR